MSLGWLFSLALIVVFAWAIARHRGGAPQSAKPAEERPAPSAVTSLRRPATEFDRVLKQIDVVWKAEVASLESVQKLGDLLCCAYPSFINVLQQRQIERTVPQALVGKPVSWDLTLNGVRERDGCFVPGGTDAGGLLVSLVKPGPLLLVECQTLDRRVLGLPLGHSVNASGRIVCATILWPSISLMVTDALVYSPDMVALPPPPPPPPPIASQATPVAVQTPRLDPAKEPSYQTAPLTVYSKEFWERAEGLFELVKHQLGRQARKNRGSFAISARSSSETAAKIVIYQRGLGRRSGEWPPLADGVYVLVRCNGAAGNTIWNGDRLESHTCHHRLNREQTLGIAPKHRERYAYFRLEPADELQAAADLLITCASA